MTRKLALVGIGKIAIDQHVPSITASSDWELAATVSRHGSVDGVDAFTDINRLLTERPDIEMISLCVPPGPRYDYAVAALKAKRHVMLEKPPGATLAECHALEAIARKQGVTLYATWHSRMAAHVPAAKAFLAGKKVRKARITWKEDVRYWHGGQDWIWQPGGLGVFDPGINALSIATEILPQSFFLSNAKLEFPENSATPIAARMDFSFENGAVMDVEFDWRQEGLQTWEIAVETDNGQLLIRNGGADLSINGVEQGADGTDDDLDGEYPRLYARMTELIEAGDSDVDLTPLVHVADAFLRGDRVMTEAFHW